MFFIVLIVMASLATCVLAAYAVRDIIFKDGRRTRKLVLGIAGLYAGVALFMLLGSLVNWKKCVGKACPAPACFAHSTFLPDNSVLDHSSG
jgi:hypothetical protein